MAKTKTTPRRIPPLDADYSSYEELDLELEETSYEDYLDELEQLSPVQSPEKAKKPEKEVKKTEKRKKKLSEKGGESGTTKEVAKSPPKKRFVVCYL